MSTTYFDKHNKTRFQYSLSKPFKWTSTVPRLKYQRVLRRRSQQEFLNRSTFSKIQELCLEISNSNCEPTIVKNAFVAMSIYGTVCEGGVREWWGVRVWGRCEGWGVRVRGEGVWEGEGGVRDGWGYLPLASNMRLVKQVHFWEAKNRPDPCLLQVLNTKLVFLIFHSNTQTPTHQHNTPTPWNQCDHRPINIEAL